MHHELGSLANTLRKSANIKSIKRACSLPVETRWVSEYATGTCKWILNRIDTINRSLPIGTSEIRDSIGSYTKLRPVSVCMKLLEEKNLPAWKVISMMKTFESFVEKEKGGFEDTVMRMYAEMLCLAIRYRIVCCPSFPTVLFAFGFSWKVRTVISRNFVIDSLKEYILSPCDDCDEENMNYKYYVDEMLSFLVRVEHSEQVAMAIENCLDYDSDSSYSSDDEVV